MIGKREERNGLYCFAPNNASICNSAVSISSADVWHRRLGHLSSKTQNLLSSSVPGIYVSDFNHCNICPLAKQTRLPFPISTHAIFEIIHCDILGPHHTESISGARYFLTIVDDYSRATWVYLMSNKSETLPILQSFIKFITNQFDKRVKKIQSDNGEEFDMKVFFIKRMGFCIKPVVWTLPNKMGLLSANIDIYSMLLVLCGLKHTFLFNFGVIAFLLLHI